jgi:hypothetical protein
VYLGYGLIKISAHLTVSNECLAMLYINNPAASSLQKRLMQKYTF